MLSGFRRTCRSSSRKAARHEMRPIHIANQSSRRRCPRRLVSPETTATPTQIHGCGRSSGLVSGTMLLAFREPNASIATPASPAESRHMARHTFRSTGPLGADNLLARSFRILILSPLWRDLNAIFMGERYRGV
jgi:hypothetical protein